MTDPARDDNGPAPSGWIARCAPLVPAGGAVLDIAAGSGRHSRLFVARGHPVTALDKDVSRLPDLPGLDRIEADLEDGSPWPVPDRTFAGVVVANYLHRPLFPVLLDSVAPGGTLIYETFALGNEKYGRPSNPDFLLQEGELLQRLSGRMTGVAFEQGYMQRVVAVRGGPAVIPPRG